MRAHELLDRIADFDETHELPRLSRVAGIGLSLRLLVRLHLVETGKLAQMSPMVGDINGPAGKIPDNLAAEPAAKLALRPEQCRAARALLNWTQQQLADRAHVARATVRDFETARHRLHGGTQALIVATLIAAGVGFLADSGIGFGVFLRTDGHDAG